MTEKAEVVLNQKKVFWITGVNPQPWQVPAPAGRGKAKFWIKHEVLKGYQNAVREEMEALWPYGPFHCDFENPVALSFVLWRQLENVRDAHGHWHRGNVADATNLQKALEDALQGVLFTNDRYVADVHTRIVEQSPFVEPKIGICIKPAEKSTLVLGMESSE